MCTLDALDPIAVYVHTPFCPTKCGYCDFNSYAMSGGIMARTTAATVAEVSRSPWRGRPAKTIFFGGGTPTFLPIEQLVGLLEAVFRVHPPLPDAEITSEANPGTVDAERFVAMRAAGFNRISLGAQSFLDADLVRLGRVHRSGEIERAVGAARSAGFANVNVDLMFALPGQSLRAWEDNLRRALGLGTEHLSLYGLTLEPNTPFYKEHLRGALILPEDEVQVAMYEAACAVAAAEGLAQYEISNFARPGYECRHNLAYWRGEEYAAYGPGAVGCVAMADEPRVFERYTNLKHPERYCEAIENGDRVAYDRERIDDTIRRIESVMLGLRLNEGFEPKEGSVSRRAAAAMEARGWIEWSGPRMRLTGAGRHFCSEVTAALLP
ncbi:MAG: radical SAM family heme chaperone HemW [Fimbriimonadaceae bacterium]|nr:radical SAM family heme chaperone HemW [Fimbriimonadaceae bacterium]